MTSLCVIFCKYIVFLYILMQKISNLSNNILKDLIIMHLFCKTPESFLMLKMLGKYGIWWFSARTSLFEGKVDGVWSPGAGLISIATYKSQKIGEASIFATVETKFLYFKWIRISFENRPYLWKRYVLAGTNKIPKFFYHLNFFFKDSASLKTVYLCVYTII